MKPVLSLPEEKLAELRASFDEQLRATEREGVEELIAYLSDETDFYTAPASTSRHGAICGGLILHSVTVLKYLRNFIKPVAEEIPEDSVVIAALLHDPEILFLDEPTIGLDAVTKLNLRAFLRAHNQKGVTMVLTTHDMDDISALCSRVMVIGKGRLLFDGDMGEMRRRYAPARVIKARFEADVAPFALEGAQSVEMDGRAVKVTFLPEQAHADALIANLASRGSLADLTVEDTDVEHLVADMYKEMDG